MEHELLKAYLRFCRGHQIRPSQILKNKELLLRAVQANSYKRIDTVSDMMFNHEDALTPVHGDVAIIHHKVSFPFHVTSWQDLHERAIMEQIVILDDEILEDWIHFTYGRYLQPEFQIPIEVIQERLIEAHDLARARNDMNQ